MNKHKCDLCGKFRSKKDLAGIMYDDDVIEITCYYCCSKSDRERYFKDKHDKGGRGMTKEAEQAFLKAWDEVKFPQQGSEGYIPDRGGFKHGFLCAYELQQKRIEQLEKKFEIAKEALKEIADTDTPWCIGPRIALAKIESEKRV